MYKRQLQAQIDANNAAVKADADKMAELEAEEAKLADRIQEIMYTIDVYKRQFMPCAFRPTASATTNI